MPLLVGLLAVLCAILLFRLFTLEKDLRSGARQLKERRETASGAPLRLAAPSSSAEALLAQVNALLRQGEDERSAFREREKALRQQIANVSHDLRTPLTSIRGYLQLMEDDTLTDEERRRCLAVVAERARVLQDLIAAFYDLSRLEAGEYTVSRERVDLRGILSELLAAFYSDLEAKFRVEVELPEVLPPVWGDRAALTRVYANLIRNALDHGEGTLTITARETTEGVETRFENGGEVGEEDLPHVFDRFYTSDQTRSGRNTGLGLAIVKALADRMGGRVRAERSNDSFAVVIVWKK